ncbi:MarR family transcriptional regulator [Roseibium sp. CAU 1637]|uniref:MarR family transcriptional regulator n=1 Tax=Roseibium limicola TaxID=2816037 RepID=A0A939EQA1_9HYPH|nr:MarR family transcriptional regulator [Roseibium limicola]MBO0346617.1 MarR family transcriptional regulator [Roseibium limicola]
MDAIDHILKQWARERPDLDTGPMGLIGRLTRLRAHLSREMEKTFSRFGLNSASFDLLATLYRSGEPYALQPGMLAQTMLITSGTMTNRIDQLVKTGLVERRRSEEDRRSVAICLTEAGKALISEAVEAHVATQHTLVAGLSEKDRDQLTALLGTYLAMFEADQA